MPTYRLYDLNDKEFEALVIQICMRLLGIGTFSFASGKDGGRDGRFAGTAKSYPSPSSPLDGKFIIQAKHTTIPCASCSDGAFAQIMKKERPRIEALANNDELDHYLLFTNRRLAANQEAKLRQSLLKIANLNTAAIFGQETIVSYLVGHHKIWRDLGFDRDEVPFRVNPQDLVKVILRFQQTVMKGDHHFDSATNFTYVKKQKKNKLNKLSKSYFEYIQSDSLPYFERIKQFLEDPRNESFRGTYHDAADQLKGKIVTWRDRFTSFDEVLTFLYEEIAGHPDLDGSKRLVRIFLHYMYFDCDIGRHA